MACTSKPQRKLLKKGLIKTRKDTFNRFRGALNPSCSMKLYSKFHRILYSIMNKSSRESELVYKKAGELLYKIPKKHRGNINVLTQIPFYNRDDLKSIRRIRGLEEIELKTLRNWLELGIFDEEASKYHLLNDSI